MLEFLEQQWLIQLRQIHNDTREQLRGLVAAFKKQYAFFNTAKYSEAQLRIGFLNPLLKSFGWDVDNERATSQFLRDVVQEEAIEVEDADVITKKNPDYTLRISGNRKLFVEARKAAIDIETSKTAAFQTRRYLMDVAPDERVCPCSIQYLQRDNIGTCIQFFARKNLIGG